MQAIRSILVVIEPEHSESLALKRAKLIAGVTQAHLHLLVCDKKHEHSALLSVLKSSLLSEGYSVTTEQAWNDSLHSTIIDVQQAEGCGLVHIDDGFIQAFIPGLFGRHAVAAVSYTHLTLPTICSV